jgi:hypothetical protein
LKQLLEVLGRRDLMSKSVMQPFQNDMSQVPENDGKTLEKRPSLSLIVAPSAAKDENHRNPADAMASDPLITRASRSLFMSVVYVVFVYSVRGSLWEMCSLPMLTQLFLSLDSIAICLDPEKH